MTFYVIGNGFDRHYGLPTGYYDFKTFLLNNGYGELVRKIDSLFYERGFSINEVKWWSEFENMLTVFAQLYADDIYNEAMDNAETDDDRAGYWDSPAWNVGYYNQYIRILKEQFDLWIKAMDTSIHQDNYFSPKEGDCIVSFNYTQTIENNFNTFGVKIYHIHGTIGQEIILGHNEYQEPDYFSIIEDEGSDYRDTTCRKAVNDVLEHAANQYYKNSPDVLRRYKKIFATIPEYDKVVFMGLSCGEQDAIYVQEIIKHAHHIDFYYRGETARENMEYYSSHSSLSIKYINW